MPETLAYHVPGMSCAHCESAVKGELGLVAGVEEVTVNLESKRLTVTGSGLDDSALRGGIDDAGYDVDEE